VILSANNIYSTLQHGLEGYGIDRSSGYTNVFSLKLFLVESSTFFRFACRVNIVLLPPLSEC
jgi:hypothetical protein